MFKNGYSYIFLQRNQGKWHTFLSRFSFTDIYDSQDRIGRERTIFYYTLPLPPAHKHSDIYLSHILNRNPFYQTATRWEFTTLSNYHLIDWWCEVYFSLFTWWFDTRFLLQQSWYGKPVQSNSKLPSILGINSRFYQNQGEYHEERLQWDALVWFEPESTIFHQFCDFWGMDMYSMEMWFSPDISSGVKMKTTATKNYFKESQLTKKIDQL